MSDVFFKNGSPTNPDAWHYFKNLHTQVYRGDVALSQNLIEEGFNPVINAWTLRIVKSSVDMFKSHCEMNGMYCYESSTPRIYIVTRKPNNH